jgi:hypothetical protein
LASNEEVSKLSFIFGVRGGDCPTSSKKIFGCSDLDAASTHALLFFSFFVILILRLAGASSDTYIDLFELEENKKKEGKNEHIQAGLRRCFGRRDDLCLDGTLFHESYVDETTAV